MISLLPRRSAALPIGVDVGTTGIRAAQIRPEGDAFKVIASAVYCRRADGAEGSERDTLDEQIGHCLQQGGFAGRRVVIGLNPPDVEFHALELPEATLSASATEVEQMVRWEVARLGAEGDDEFETRHWRVPTGSPSSPNAIGVAARRAPVVAVVEATASAGMNCTAVDCGAAALVRVGHALLSPEADCVWGVLDLGARESRLVVAIDETPVLIRCVGPGQRDWSKRIADVLHVSVETAEIHKCEHGISPNVRESRGAAPPEADGEIGALLFSALRQDLTDIAAEIKKSYEYTLCCYPRRRADTLVLTGGGACIANLSYFFHHLLGIPVSPAAALLETDRCRLGYTAGKRSPLEITALAVGLSIPPEARA